MAKKQDIKARDLTGHNIYQLNNGNQTIYYDSYTKTAFIITNSAANKFSTWQLRVPLIFFAMAIMLLAKYNLILTIGVGIAAYILSTVLFHTKFLNDQPIQTNFKLPPSKGFLRNIGSKYEMKTLIFMAIAFFVMGILIIVNQFINTFDDAGKILNIILMSVSFVASIVLTIIIFIKRKENL